MVAAGGVDDLGNFEDMLVEQAEGVRVGEHQARSLRADGRTQGVEIHVTGAVSFVEARRVAKTIAHSPLVKTALYGEEFNWGRILCAASYSGVDFDPVAERAF